MPAWQQKDEQKSAHFSEEETLFNFVLAEQWGNALVKFVTWSHMMF